MERPFVSWRAIMCTFNYMEEAVASRFILGKLTVAVLEHELLVDFKAYLEAM